MKIQFTKMHGAGNDYIYVDTARYPIADPARCANAGLPQDALAQTTWARTHADADAAADTEGRARDHAVYESREGKVWDAFLHP